MNGMILSQDLVFVDQQDVYTDSLIVARVFEKSHARVLKDIRSLIDDLGDMKGEVKFDLSSYMSEQNKELPKYNLCKDALTLLVMGYTTKKAMKMKLDYIKAFKKMESYVKTQVDLESQLFRAMEKEEVSFANGSMAGKYLQKRKMEKPIIKEEIESILHRLQIDMFEEVLEKQMIH